MRASTMAATLRVGPAGHRDKVCDKALDVAREDDIIVEHDRLEVHIHSIILARH
jgi:hypothetical protein